MKSLWNPDTAKAFLTNDIDIRVYTSRLLGQSDDLVLHGGGNTSVKIRTTNLFGEDEDILYVKGSGWDLKTIEAAGFAPTRLNYLKKLATLETLSDTDMARELKASQLDPNAPAPSVEAILHAIIPYKFVDHTHTDAVVAVSNTVNGNQILQDIFGSRVLILPYIMPGFILAKQVFEATREIDWQSLDGIMLLHHGLFTFHDDAKCSYEKMIELVTKAEDYLKEINAFDNLASATYTPTVKDYRQLAAIRRQVSELAGQPMLARWQQHQYNVGFSQLKQVTEIATRGPLTPDHTLHTKRIPAIIGEDIDNEIKTFSSNYMAYFRQHATDDLTCLDPAPRFAIWKDKGTLSFGPNYKRLGVVSDITDHTLKAIQWGEALGGWQALSPQHIFDIEYWELEQAKLKKVTVKPTFEGKVVLVTGAASGIGLACAKAFMDNGACVVGLDINPKVTESFSTGNYLGLTCDVTCTNQIQHTIQQTVASYGGLDIVVSNAGAFPPSTPIEALSDDALQASTELNFSSHVKLLREATPFLKLGIDASFVIIASKNVAAPGPGAGAYSAPKAALTQMARVAALELGEHNIRVNTIHPNAIFDTGVWTAEVLAQRAKHYGLTVEEYKQNNILKTEITSADVAQLATTIAGPAFAKTTGSQTPIDGGNERVI